MATKASSVRMVGSGSRGETQALRRVVRAILGLAMVALTVAGAYLLVMAVRPDAAAGIAAGVEASSARWSAMGEAYLAKIAAGVEASSARWAALGRSVTANAHKGVADSARWAVLGAGYLARYEAAAVACSARYQAMAEAYANMVAQGK